ncbi:carbamate kinase [Streptoalloteichus hindustanus]|uniref:Carbamate kinase n=1 Tax=Streptoalloteichus hindustanus TaxID=2017 RepID=A0A1M5DST7_STRHI|nr:carbamate kinase [Streptoalloteichus hindustanus]SHF70006.1 carbamate kinase [Streptoalloteichus hindustanus]
MRVVAALGGNALLRRGQRPDHAVQMENVRAAAAALAGLAREHEVLVVHGNGPQVGMLALESAADRDLERPYPLDVLVAETQGMIGYWLVNALHAELPDREVVAVLSRTAVDPDDRAFAHPTKFIGPQYPRAEAERLAADRGWELRPDGRAWRRVVPSPEPTGIPETAVLRRLLADGCLVVTGGGGGTPVALDAEGRPRGVEAVVDKDLVAALLATQLDADALLLLTDVPGVLRGFGSPAPELVARASAAELAELDLPAGSMGPKVEACARFARTGGLAAIGQLTRARDVLAGRAGTRVTG